MDVYGKLKELGLSLPNPPTKGGLYAPAKEFGDRYVYISGCGPNLGTKVSGKLGRDFTIEEGMIFSRNSMLNVLSLLEAKVGDLNKVKGAVKILVFVNSADDFCSQPKVANGGSQLLLDLFGEEELPARSAIGVNALPNGIPVETEAIFELMQ